MTCSIVMNILFEAEDEEKKLQLEINLARKLLTL